MKLQATSLDHQAGIKIAGRKINVSDIQMTPSLWQKGRETKSLTKLKQKSTCLAENSCHNKYHILMYIQDIRKMVLKNLLQDSNGEADMKNRLMDKERRGVGSLIWKEY